MASKLKTHCANGPPSSLGVYIALCTAPCAKGQIAGHPTEVTCVNCLKKMGEVREPKPEATTFRLPEHQRSEWMDAQPEQRAVKMPPVDRDNWRCHAGKPCGKCQTCKAYRDIDRLPSDDDSYRRGQIRRREPRIDVDSMIPALTWYANRMDDGARIKGCNEWIVRLEGIPGPDRGERLDVWRRRALALLTAPHGWVPDDTRHFAHAVLKRRIEAILARMYRGNQRVSRERCFRILFARLVGTRQMTKLGPRRFPLAASKIAEAFGLTPGQVGAIVQAGKRDYLLACQDLAIEMEGARAA